MRASTYYEQVDWQPGTPPKIISVPNRNDLSEMVADIKQAKSAADVVVVSMHWGIYFVPAMIADYQRVVAHEAIDAGADLILGHHPHILKGIEVYKGRVIFYSLGNFAFDNPVSRHTPGRNLYGIRPAPDYRDYYFSSDSRKTMIAECLISPGSIREVSFLPAMINGKAQPEPLSSSDSRNDEVYRYVAWCTAEEKLPAQFQRKGDEIGVITSQ